MQQRSKRNCKKMEDIEVHQEKRIIYVCIIKINIFYLQSLIFLKQIFI